MSFLDKIMFWKKDPDFGVDLDKDFSLGKEPDFGQQPDFGNTGLGPSAMDVSQNQGMQHYGQSQSGFGQQESSQFSQQAQYPGYQDFSQPRSAPVIQHVPEAREAQQVTYSKDLEVISAKLDAIKAVLESMNARIHNLERMARDQKEKTQHW